MSIIFNPTSGRNDTVILLVHGWESNASRWEKILPYLKIRSTIIAIDALHMVCLVARNLTFQHMQNSFMFSSKNSNLNTL
jgi:hypothetical protein